MEHRDVTIENYIDLFEAVREFVRERYMQPTLSLGDFSREYHYARRSVQRALEHHETNWREVLTEQRMEMGRWLLSVTALPVSEISKKVGYMQPAQFAKTFRRRTGFTPTKFRANSQTPHEGR